MRRVETLPELPYPPTVNTYWRRVGNKTLLSARAREYRADVAARVAYRVKRFDGPVKVTVVFRPPDRRTRDIDNLPKALLDSLTHAGVLGDDSQVRWLDIRFAEVRPGGAAVVTVSELEEK